MSLRVLQMLFVVSWAAWACLPLWGGVAFAAMEVTLLVGVWQRSRAARKELSTTLETVPAGLTDEGRAFLDRYAFFFVKRLEAREWGRMLRATALAALLLVPVFAVHAFVRADLVHLSALVPSLLFFALNTWLAPSLEVDEWVKEPGREAEKALSDAVTKAISARQLSGIDFAALGPRLSGPPGGAPPPEGP